MRLKQEKNYIKFLDAEVIQNCARDLFESQIPVTAGVFELQISCIRSSCLTFYSISGLSNITVRNLV